MSKLKDFYSNTTIPYISREDMKQMIADQEVFSITGVSTRFSTYKGQTREEWVITVKLAGGESGLITLTKSTNRDTQIENIMEHLPVDDVKLVTVGASNAYAFVPSDYVETVKDDEEAEESTTGKSRRRK